MHKIDYIRRQPWIGDYNTLVDAVNLLIDKINRKKEVAPVEISREVKDYSFFLGEEVALPYKVNFILTTPEEAADVFSKYALTYKETSNINDIITRWDIVALEINVTEEVTEKDKKQETMFEEIKTIDFNSPVKVKWKRGRKKKTSWE